ncbi:hypothetical protein [Lysinibacillus sp. 54212]|uniref:hypothetical protein n=1 Tax=Lysinibacillus sp. 54212 TaxID=3119829 RepID=UPI002FCC0E5C
MNKKYLFTAAAIPVAFILPTVTEAVEQSTVIIVGTPAVNETVRASIANIPADTIIKEYQWYFIETAETEDDKKTTIKKPISGATASTYTLPVTAAGKAISVEATSTTGDTYKSETVEVNTLSLEIKAPTFIDFTSGTVAAPGETVKVSAPSVTDKNGAKLQSSQIAYSYQWYYKEGEAFSIISGATDASYEIPEDALEHNIKAIMVKVKASVGTAEVESSFSELLTISKEPSETLSTDIDALRKKQGKHFVYNVTDLMTFKANVTDLENRYKALTPGAKANVTNYSVLERAIADVAAITAIEDKMNKIGEVTEQNLARYLKELEAAYDKLDFLQRSLDIDENLYNSIKLAMDKPGDIGYILEVRRINEAIIALLNYDHSLPQYTPENIESLKTAVQAIEADIAKLPRDYQSIVQNQLILRGANQDITVVNRFIKMFDKLLPNLSPNKQVTLAASIRNSYGRLTYKQMQLVPSTYVSRLLAAELAEQKQIDELNAEIAAYLGKDSYNVKPTEATWDEYAENIKRIIADYKTLTKNSAAKIVDYAGITTLQRDLKASENVIKQINKYNALAKTSSTKESQLVSSYKSAFTVYNRLTSLQQSLIYNADEFLENSPKVTIVENGKVPGDKAQAVALKEDIAALANVKKYTFAQFEAAINEANATYKKLSGSARKYVTNYYVLQAASQDVRAVTAFHKRIQAAKEEKNITRQIQKIKSVQTSYTKLPANQQYLAKAQFESLLAIADTVAPDLSKLNAEIGAIVSNGLYIANIDSIKDLITRYYKLNGNDRKFITNGTILIAANSDVRRVESFLKQYEKTFEKNPASIVTAFGRLTAKQMSLVSEEVRQKIIQAETDQQTPNETVLKIIESINLLLLDGVYTDQLQTKVTDIRTAYNELSNNEKYLVKNYSKLTEAESDLKLVADVQELYKAIPAEDDDSALKKWQVAYNKLSKKQELLYKAMYPTDVRK